MMISRSAKVAVVTLALGSAVATSTPAQASPQYAGKDPMVTSCIRDARTLASAPITTWGIFRRQQVGVVELRYSNRCKTAWATTRSSVGRSKLSATVTGHLPGRAPATYTEAGDFVTSWSPMVAVRRGSYVTVRGTLWNAYHTSRQTEENVASAHVP